MVKGADMAQADQVDEALAEPAVAAVPIVDDVASPLVPKPRRLGFVGALLGGALAAMLGFGLAQFVPGGWPFPDPTALEARLAAQDGVIAALKAEVAAIGAKPADSDLEQRIAAIEAAVPATPDIAPLDARLSALEAEFAALATAPGGDSRAALAALRAEVERLKTTGSGNVAALTAEAEARMKEAETQATRLKAEAEALASDAKLQAALGRVQAALDSGAPYGSALQDLGADVPAVLLGSAETGLPTLADLQDGFSGAARLALEASLTENMGESWSERVAAFLRSQTGARSLTPREGNDPDAILSRAEAALAAGEVTLALTEVATLPKVGQDAMTVWRTAAELRLAAEAAIAALVQRLGE